MRKLTGLVALALTAACSVHVGTDSSQPNSPPRQQARAAPAPAPRPAPAPAPAPAPPPARALGRAPAPAAPAAPAPAPTQASAISPGLANVGALNVSVIREIKSANPKPCGYVEVSPGNWTHIDCDKYKPAAKAVPHLGPKKLKLVRAHKTMFKPLAVYKKLGKAPPRTPAAAAAGAAGGGPAQVAEAFPNTVDHRVDNTEGPIKNQGGVGSCTAHSLSAALDNAAIRAGNLRPGDKNAMTSPLHVWSRYGLPNMGAAADGNIAQPVAVYTNWPQSDREACMLFQGTGSYASECARAYGVKAGAWREDKAIVAKYDKSQAEGVYKISSIEKLAVEPPDMEELLGILSSGADIWSAFLIDGYAWSNSKMNAGVIPDWEDPSGGHAVVISGFRETPKGRQFLIHNSWGESWGDKGYAWISEKMVQKQLYFAYKVKITNGVKKEDLTDDDCAPDELVDATTGLCALMCGDDGRPSNGCK